MEYISILPSDLDLASQHQYLRLPHPRTVLPQLYLPCPSSTSSSSSERMLEVVKISGSKRRTWFIGDSRIEAGTMLVHHPVDPLFLVIPMILSLLPAVRLPNPQGADNVQDQTISPPFQRLSDLISTVCSSSQFSLSEPFSRDIEGKNEAGNGKEGEYNQDISRSLSLKSIRRVFKLCCERKVVSAAPPSPPVEDGITASSPKDHVYYRPSRQLVIKLLKIKVDYFAEEERWGCFDHLVRSLGRDGLLGANVDVGLVQAARIKASVEQLAQWLPSSITNELMGSYDLSNLSQHLLNLSAAAIAAAQPIITGVKKDDKGNLKRKLPAASRGVESLKKVNTASMSKLTSFFKPKDGKVNTA